MRDSGQPWMTIQSWNDLVMKRGSVVRLNKISKPGIDSLQHLGLQDDSDVLGID